MEKKILFFIALIILSASVYGDLLAEAEPIKNSIYLDEQATFIVYLENTQSYEKILNIYTNEIKWYVEAVPSPPRISGETRKRFEITLIPSVWAEPGAQSVRVFIESPNTKERLTLQLPVFVKSYDTERKEYKPSVELTATFQEKIDPRTPISLELYMRNRNMLNIDEMTVIISSSLFYDEKIISIGPMSEIREKYYFNVNPNTEPIQDNLVITLTYDNKTTNRENIVYEIIPYSEFEEKRDVIKNLFKTRTDYTITNKGNVDKKEAFSVRVSLLQNIFTKANPRPDKINLKEQYYEWNLNLEPNEQVQIQIIKNYRPALYLFFMVLVVVMVYFLYRSPVIVKKESIVAGSAEEGISEIKVLLHIRNRSSELIENLSLTDLIPSIADLVKEENIGSLSPSKVLKHHKKGTIIKWEFEVIEPFEERIISYRIKTKITILGGFTLPKAKMKFLKKDTERIVKSNKSQVNIGI
jgi:hypothetical protein